MPYAHTVPRMALRAAEPSDIDFMYECENAADVYTEGSQLAPVSHHALVQLVNSSFLPISESGQVRLIATLLPMDAPVGLVDLFDIHLINRTASVGIAIYPRDQRQKGYGCGALQLLEDYASRRLNLRALYAEVRISNEPSMQLFSRAEYLRVGTKRRWLRSHRSDGWEDAACFQKFLCSG